MSTRSNDGDDLSDGSSSSQLSLGSSTGSGCGLVDLVNLDTGKIASLGVKVRFTFL